MNRTVHKIQSKPRSKYNFLLFCCFCCLSISCAVDGLAIHSLLHLIVSLHSFYLLAFSLFVSCFHSISFSFTLSVPHSFFPHRLDDYTQKKCTQQNNVIIKLNAASKIAYECNASMIGAGTRSLCKIEKFAEVGWS